MLGVDDSMLMRVDQDRGRRGRVGVGRRLGGGAEWETWSGKKILVMPGVFAEPPNAPMEITLDEVSGFPVTS